MGRSWLKSTRTGFCRQHTSCNLDCLHYRPSVFHHQPVFIFQFLTTLRSLSTMHKMRPIATYTWSVGVSLCVCLLAQGTVMVLDGAQISRSINADHGFLADSRSIWLCTKLLSTYAGPSTKSCSLTHSLQCPKRWDDPRAYPVVAIFPEVCEF